jgi:hypothetical protein
VRACKPMAACGTAITLISYTESVARSTRLRAASLWSAWASASVRPRKTTRSCSVSQRPEVSTEAVNELWPVEKVDRVEAVGIADVIAPNVGQCVGRALVVQRAVDEGHRDNFRNAAHCTSLGGLCPLRVAAQGRPRAATLATRTYAKS